MDTSMEDFPLTQLPSAQLRGDAKAKSVVWTAPKAKNGDDTTLRQEGSSLVQDTRLAKSQSLPSTSRTSPDIPALSLTQSCSNTTRKRKRERPLARRSLSAKQQQQQRQQQQDDNALIDSFPITQEMIQNIFKSVTERVDAEVAKAKAREEERKLEQLKARKEREKRAARTMRELKNIGEGSSPRSREASATVRTAATITESGDAAPMDIDELRSNKHPRIIPNTSSPSTSQQNSRATEVMLPPELVQAITAEGSRSATPLAPSSLHASSHAEATVETKAGAMDGIGTTSRFASSLPCEDGGAFSSLVPLGREGSQTTTPSSSKLPQQSSGSASGYGGRTKSSMIPVSSSGSRPPTLGMRRTPMANFSMSQERSGDASVGRVSLSRQYSSPVSVSSGLPTRQKHFRPPFVSMGANRAAHVSSESSKQPLASPSTSPYTPSGQDRQTSMLSGLPTPSSTTRSLPSSARGFMSQAPKQPSPLRKSILPTTPTALVSPPPSQTLSQAESVVSTASPPPPSMDVDMQPLKKISRDRSSSPAPEANISLNSSEFDMSLDAEELEKVLSMYD